MQKHRKHKWNAGDYAANSSAQAKWGRELIAQLNLRGDEAILDIGCGDGKLTAELARQVPNGFVRGADSSAEMIRFAKKSFPSVKFPNLSFKVCDARRLAFKDKFDLVVSFACLHWVKDHMPVLEGIRCSLKGGGRALLQFGGKGNAEDVIAVAGELIVGDPWKKYFRGFICPWHFYEPKEYAAWVKKAGLVPQRIELIAKDMVQNGKDGLIGWMRTTWAPYIGRLPLSLRDKFLTEIADRYLARYPLNKSGCAHVKVQRLEVEAINE